MSILSTRPSLPTYIDSTMLTAFRSCPRKFMWNFAHNLHPAGKSVHLVAGGAFAAGCDAARTFALTHPYPDTLSQADILVPAMSAFIREWGDYQAPEGSAKSFEGTFSALEQYLAEFDPRTDILQALRRKDGSPVTEFSFSIPLGVNHPETNEPFIFCGRFDMLAKHTGANINVMVDEKTTSALGAYWLKQWDLRGQFIGYCWALQQLGYPIDTAVVRGIAILKTQVNFATAMVQYPAHVIERWHMQTLVTLQRMVEAWENNYFDYNFGDACGSYGGCSYADLCLAKDPSAWTNNYIHRVWNPISRTAVAE